MIGDKKDRRKVSFYELHPDALKRLEEKRYEVTLKIYVDAKSDFEAEEKVTEMMKGTSQMGRLWEVWGAEVHTKETYNSKRGYI